MWQDPKPGGAFGDLQGLIFDFDGLILDTELPEYQSWQEIFQEHGRTLPLPVWATRVGTSSSVFDPYVYLEEQLGSFIDRQAVQAKHRQRCRELQRDQDALPGVRQCIHRAKALGMKLGVASSSRHAWVDGNLTRLGLYSYFDCIRCRDDVEQVKPHPELYLLVLRDLGLRPDQAIVLEDSPNGILAAKRAGIFCVAIPNAVTRDLPFDSPDLVLHSMDDLPLEELLLKARAKVVPMLAPISDSPRPSAPPRP